MKRFKILALAMVLVMAAALAGINGTTVRAEEPIKLDRTLVLLWPEYDSPDVLVIIEGLVSESVPLPAEMVMQVPAEPTVVAYADKDGNLFEQEFTAIQVSDGFEVRFQLTERGFQVEYYYDPMKREGDRRQFSYVFKPDYATTDLFVNIQEPYGSARFAAEPKSPSLAKSDDGFVYHRYAMSNVQPAQSFGWSVSYDKSDPHPSKQLMQIKGVKPGSGNGLPIDLPYIIGASAIAVLAILAVAYRVGWLARLRPARARGTVASAPRSGAMAKFCPECGTRLPREAKFCFDCGAEQ